MSSVKYIASKIQSLIEYTDEKIELLDARRNKVVDVTLDNYLIAEINKYNLDNVILKQAIVEIEKSKIDNPYLTLSRMMSTIRDNKTMPYKERYNAIDLLSSIVNT